MLEFLMLDQRELFELILFGVLLFLQIFLMERRTKGIIPWLLPSVVVVLVLYLWLAPSPPYDRFFLDSTYLYCLTGMIVTRQIMNYKGMLGKKKK